MILTPYDTVSTLDPSGLESVDLYYHVPNNDNLEKDLADTVNSLQDYLKGSDYSIIDSGELAEGGCYITYLKGKVAPAETVGSNASMQGKENPIVKIFDDVVTSTGKALNGGTLSGNGGINGFFTKIGEIAIPILIIVLVILIVK
jgi:hypothetical protein